MIKPTQQDWEAICWTWAEAKRSQQRIPKGNTRLVIDAQAAVEEAELELLAAVGKYEAAALHELSPSAPIGKPEKPPIATQDGDSWLRPVGFETVAEPLHTNSDAFPPRSGTVEPQPAPREPR